MNMVETIAAKIVTLPLDQQCEVLEFVEFKLQRLKDDKTANGWNEQTPQQRSSNFGSLAHLGLTVTDEDIAEVRREMWVNFPRVTVPEMPDRIIAATALALGLPLVTADTEIRKLTNIPIIW